MIFTVVLTERLSLVCQRVPDTGPQAVRLRVGGLWLSSSSVVYLVGHRALPLVSLME